MHSVNWGWERKQNKFLIARKTKIQPYLKPPLKFSVTWTVSSTFCSIRFLSLANEKVSWVMHQINPFSNCAFESRARGELQLGRMSWGRYSFVSTGTKNNFIASILEISLSDRFSCFVLTIAEPVLEMPCRGAWRAMLVQNGCLSCSVAALSMVFCMEGCWDGWAHFGYGYVWESQENMTHTP